MSFKRMFTKDEVKGTRNYLSSQKKYEIIRTAIYFFIPLSLFAAGYITTHTRNNLLTLVAVLGCLPACKSLVEMIMHCRYKSLSADICDTIEDHAEGLTCLYDCVFTSRDKTYYVGHLAVCGNTIAGYLLSSNVSEMDGAKHLETCLKVDRYTGLTIKLYKDLDKYTERLDSLRELKTDDRNTKGIVSTLKAISL